MKSEALVNQSEELWDCLDERKKTYGLGKNIYDLPGATYQGKKKTR